MSGPKCHRCGKTVAGRGVMMEARRLSTRTHRVYVEYHRRCLPPKLFHKAADKRVLFEYVG